MTSVLPVAFKRSKLPDLVINGKLLGFELALFGVKFWVCKSSLVKFVFRKY